MEALLAIGLGSDQPPRLIVLEYSPPKGARPSYWSEGVCYDSGGINLKRKILKSMKSDMAGVPRPGTLQALLSGAVGTGPWCWPPWKTSPVPP